MYGGVIKNFVDFENLVGRVQNFAPSTRLLAILFMRKGQDVTDKLIVPSLGYFHVRSGQNLHFIMPGWFYQQAGRGTDPDTVERGWFYDDKLFVRGCDVIASETTWKYSGGTDLLLITTRGRSGDQVVLDFSGAINIPLHLLVSNKLGESPEIVIERLIRFAESYKGADPLLHLSLQEARVSFFEAVVNAIKGYFPKEVKERLEYGKHFLIQDVSKENRSGRALVRIR